MILNAPPPAAAPPPSSDDWADDWVDHEPVEPLEANEPDEPTAEPDDTWYQEDPAPEATVAERATRPAAGTAAPLDDLDVPDRYRSDQFDDLDEFEEFEPAGPLFSGAGGRKVALIGGAVILALAGYAVGWSRGSADLDRGSAPTTSIVADPTGAPAVTASTQPLPDALPLPVVQLTTLSFDDGLPADLDGRAVEERGGWTAVAGGIAPEDPDPMATDAVDPRLLGEGPDVVVDAGLPAALATVKLANPTPLSGIVSRVQDDRNYWAAVLDQTMTHLTLYEVVDGVQTARGFIDLVAIPGTTIGIFAADGKVGLTVDGQSRVMASFFGPQTAFDDQGIAGNGVGLLTGTGAPAFDDLSFG